jgi:hypothetical protein
MVQCTSRSVMRERLKARERKPQPALLENDECPFRNSVTVAGRWLAKWGLIRQGLALRRPLLIRNGLPRGASARLPAQLPQLGTSRSGDRWIDA